MSDQKWYFNLETHEVEQGKVSGVTNRMGPYDTAEQARHALDIAQARNEAADAYDEAEDED